MPEESKITISLKDSLVGLDGNPILNKDKVSTLPKYEKLTTKELNEEMAKLSSEDFKKICPKFTLGDGLKSILSTGIKPKNNEEAADLFRYIRSINNQYITAKGEWKVTKDELKKFSEFIDKATDNVNAIVNGQIKVKLDELWAEMIIKEKK